MFLSLKQGRLRWVHLHLLSNPSLPHTHILSLQPSLGAGAGGREADGQAGSHIAGHVLRHFQAPCAYAPKQPCCILWICRKPQSWRLLSNSCYYRAELFSFIAVWTARNEQPDKLLRNVHVKCSLLSKLRYIQVKLWIPAFPKTWTS